MTALNLVSGVPLGYQWSLPWIVCKFHLRGIKKFTKVGYFKKILLRVYSASIIDENYEAKIELGLDPRSEVTAQALTSRR